MKTIRQHLKNLDKKQFLKLREMCKHSNSLYNCALFEIKNFYKETTGYLTYNELYNLLKNNIHYKFLPAKIAQQTLRLADKNYRSFFALLRKKNNGQYADTIQEPKYRKSGDLYILILTEQQISIRKGFCKITKDIKFPFSYNFGGKIKQAIIRPNHNYFTIYLTYEPNDKSLRKELDKDNIIGIDLGIDNFLSCVSTVGPSSFIVSGKPIKSYNQYYNKRIAKMKSELAQCNKEQKWSNRLNQLSENRKNWIHNYFNQTLAFLLDYCFKHNVGKIIVGYNKQWKQNVNIGKSNNQKFVNIPHYLFKQKLKSKCEENGIELIFTEESYTSKCSFIDNEPLTHHENYVGTRIYRGLFKTQYGNKVNADCNGAANIIRKVVPNIKKLIDGIEGAIVRPLVFRTMFETYKDKSLYFY